MNPRTSTVLAALAACLTLFVAGCRDTDTLPPAPPNTDPVVFSDAFGEGVDYQAFLDSKLDAVDTDAVERYQGTASLKITVPGSNAPSDATFAGGAFTSSGVRDLSGYNAITFYAKASTAATLNVAGLGNDNTGSSKFMASRDAIPLTTTWTRVVIPIPFPARLTDERGLFFFAEGYEADTGYTLWFDEIRFETVTGIANPRPALENDALTAYVGSTLSVDSHTTFAVEGSDMRIDHMAGYFTLISSDEAVAKPGIGEIEVVGDGSAVITAKLGDVDATGQVTVTVAPSPAAPAPNPTLPAAQVLSIFSGAYENVTVNKWLADWSQDHADFQDLEIAGNAVKVYSNLEYAGIEFTDPTVDASTMTHFHIDVWVPEGATLFKVKLVDFGPDGIYTNGSSPEDITQHELTYDAGSTPALVPGTWVQLDIPFTQFTGLLSREHLAQLIISGTGNTVFVDNIYFHK